MIHTLNIATNTQSVSQEYTYTCKTNIYLVHFGRYDWYQSIYLLFLVETTTTYFEPSSLLQ